jgi:hypothetical protein
MRLAVAFHLQTLCVHLDQDRAVFVRAQQIYAAVGIAVHDFLLGIAEEVVLSAVSTAAMLASTSPQKYMLAVQLNAWNQQVKFLADDFRRDICGRLRAVGLGSDEHRQARSSTCAEIIRRQIIHTQIACVWGRQAGS